VTDSNHLQDLSTAIAARAPTEAVALIERESADAVARALERSSPAHAVAVLEHTPEPTRQAVLAAAAPKWVEQWACNRRFDEDTVGRMMGPAFAVMQPTLTIREAIERLREIVKTTLVSYVFVVDDSSKLVGVLVFREVLLASHDQRIADVMLPNPFCLDATMSTINAMRAVVTRHHPSYPVCDKDGTLVGEMRGETLFRHQAFELSAQAGSMVGIQKGERLTTEWPNSLRMRHPWLQLNLATAFLAATVVGLFQDTIDRLVVLAIFLPVLAGQSGNTGAQALAVTLRGMTLGDLRNTSTSRLVTKEAWLGLMNGALIGFTAGAAMFAYASLQSIPSGGMLAVVVGLAMTCSCVAAGVFGVVVPLMLRRLGADPATASSIFLTTATDCVSMGTLLALAASLVG
jgi:magnesium transporter